MTPSFLHQGCPLPQETGTHFYSEAFGLGTGKASLPASFGISTQTAALKVGEKVASSNCSSESPSLGHGMAEGTAPRICRGYQSRLEAEGGSGGSVQGRDSISIQAVPSFPGSGGWCVCVCVLQAVGRGEPEQISPG